MSCVAVLLPTKNGAARLTESLPEIVAQAGAASAQLLAVDSGSTDGTLELLRRHGIQPVEIPPHEFQHGRTRNLAAGFAAPDVEYLVYLTQDATPLPGWLDRLVSTVASDARIAGAFSRHVARPGCNPFVARRMVEEWPQVGGLKRLVKEWSGLEPAGGWHALAHFSNTSSCVRRSVWQWIPFPEVDFAEDVAWAVQVLRAGYRLVYEPASAVVHSHCGSLARQFAENVDHGWGVRQVLRLAPRPVGQDRLDKPDEGWPQLMAPRHSTGERARRDLGYIWHSYPSFAERLHWLALLPLWYGASVAGQWVGAHLDRVPAWLRPRLSWQVHVGQPCQVVGGQAGKPVLR